ncbi:hypothetical protein Pcinc_015245 [Petrolisthes cinctipes]|uniref:LRRCT domain-containing protein n=1 Tax=Petrolisthes cinctipes TaxID=88211 RepID=A0AAE1FVA2_PETCI|nr:hypothetical protein Pcinc_015245 [Petrolisthes cinctipes]
MAGPRLPLCYCCQLLLHLLLLLAVVSGVPTGRRRVEQSPRSTPLGCPPEGEVFPCVCRLRGPQLHVMCEGSEEGQVVRALEKLMGWGQPLEELHLVGNRIPVLPARVFGSLLINKLFLVNNDLTAIDRNAFAGLESSLQHLHMEEPALHSLPFDTLDHLANLRTCVLENTAVTTLPRLYSLSRLEFLKVDGSRVNSIPSAAFRFMPNMKKVHVANSKLQEVAANALEGLVYLREVNFSNNAIHWIHPRAFRTLNTVEELVLANNQLTDAVAAVLAARELRELRHFDLSNNLINHLAKGTFGGINAVANIDLSNNLISNVEAGTFYKLPSLRKLDLSGNRLQEFHSQVFQEPISLEHLNLAGNNLTFLTDLAILARVLPNLISLDLSHNHLQVTTGAIQGHPHLQSLRLDHNHINNLENGVFRYLPSLLELHLSHNLITGNLEEPAWELPQLQVLDLSYNELQQVDATLLIGLPRLRDLDLSFNVIQGVGDEALRRTTQLKNLNISFNSLTYLPDDMLDGLYHLMQLDLSFNELAALEGGKLQNLPSLQELYLSHNQVSFVSPVAFTNSSSLRYLDLSANLLQDIPLGLLTAMTSLRQLSLQHNGLRHLHDHYLQGLYSLRHLDVSHNHIQKVDKGGFHNLSNLRDLDLSVNYLETLDDTMFSGSGGVERINASHNYLRDLAGALAVLPRLRVLDLTNNSLTQLGDEVRGLRLLQGLFLADNYLTRLHNTTLEGLEHLSVLRLENNGIQTFQTGTFSGLISLLTLDLTNNNLVELQPDSLASLPVLEEVRLAKNQITIVKDFAITNLQALRSLELQDNTITEVGAHAFHQLPALQFLNLSHNGFPDVPEDSLVRLPTLQVLDLSWNYLLQIKDSSFYPLEALTVLLSYDHYLPFSRPPSTTLQLHNNDLCHLSSGSFLRQSSLRILTLNNNQLRRLHLHALGSALDHLALLDMSDNPFHCDCELVWLREYLEEAPQDEREPRQPSLPPLHTVMRGVPVCATPQQYQGKPITQVPAQAFLCEGRSGARDGMERDREEEELEVCKTRFSNPILFSEGHTGSLDSLLQLTNLTADVGIGGSSSVDYANPILVPANLLPPTFKPKPKPKPNPEAVQNAAASVPISAIKATTKRPTRPQQQQVNAVTGDTPTIYAGSASSSGGGGVSNLDNSGGNGGGGGLLDGLLFPNWPRLQDVVGLFLPHIGVNMNLGMPVLGRQDSSGVTHKLGPHDHKPMKGPDSSSPVWVDGSNSPHPHFLAPPPPPTVSPSRGPGLASSEEQHVSQGPPFPFPPGPGEQMRPGVPGVVVPVTRPPNVWSVTDRRRPGEPRPILPPVLHSGPGPSSGIPFLPGRPSPLLPHSITENTQPEFTESESLGSTEPYFLPDSSQSQTLPGPLHTQSVSENIQPHPLHHQFLPGSMHPHPQPESVHHHSLPQSVHPQFLPDTIQPHPMIPQSVPGPLYYPHPQSESVHPHPFQPSLPGVSQSSIHIQHNPLTSPVATQIQTDQNTALVSVPPPGPGMGESRLPVGGSEPPRWSHPEMIHPDSGVSHYQPGEPFLPYHPHNPSHPITIVQPPQMSGGPPPSITHTTHHLPHTPVFTHPDMSPSETQVMGGGGLVPILAPASVLTTAPATSEPSFPLLSSGPPPSSSPLTSSLTPTTLSHPHLLPSSSPPSSTSTPHHLFTASPGQPSLLPNTPQIQPSEAAQSSFLPTALPSASPTSHSSVVPPTLNEGETHVGTGTTLGDLVHLLFTAEEEVKQQIQGGQEGKDSSQDTAPPQQQEEHTYGDTEQQESTQDTAPPHQQDEHTYGDTEQQEDTQEGQHEQNQQEWQEEDGEQLHPHHTPSSSTPSSIIPPQSPATTKVTTTTTTTSTSSSSTTTHSISSNPYGPPESSFNFNIPTQSSSSNSSNSNSSDGELSLAAFPAKLGEGVSVLKDNIPRPFTTTTSTTTTSTTTIQEEDPAADVEGSWPRGVVTAVDKSGSPLDEDLEQGGGNHTYISPSRSVGRGGFPTIERVFQPGQEGQAAHSLAQPTVEAEGGPGHTHTHTLTDAEHKHTPPETEFENNDVNGIDWYYNNYHREETSLPVGGNHPPSADPAPSPPQPTTLLTPVLTCLIFYLTL